MAAAVAAACSRRKHLIVEAGTGTGKSFAYLVPAILATTPARRSGSATLPTHRDLHPHDQPAGTTAGQGSAAAAKCHSAGIHRRPGQGTRQLPEPSSPGKQPRALREACFMIRTTWTNWSNWPPGRGRPRWLVERSGVQTKLGPCGTKWPATAEIAWGRTVRIMPTASTTGPAAEHSMRRS